MLPALKFMSTFFIEDVQLAPNNLAKFSWSVQEKLSNQDQQKVRLLVHRMPRKYQEAGLQILKNAKGFHTPTQKTKGFSYPPNFFRGFYPLFQNFWGYEPSM